jgi:hypothetical protein
MKAVLQGAFPFDVWALNPFDWRLPMSIMTAPQGRADSFAADTPYERAVVDSHRKS